MKKHQSGFAVMAVFAIVAVLAVVGTAGYLVLSKDKDNDNSSQDTKKSNLTNSSSDSETDNSSNSEYLEVKEFGVKIKLTEETSDLYYSSVKKSNYGGGDYVVLSSKSLAELDSNCKADTPSENGVEGVGLIISFTKPDEASPYEGSTMSQAYPDALLVDGVYYYISPNVQGACYNDSSYDYSKDDVPKLNTTLVKFLRDEAVLEEL